MSSINKIKLPNGTTYDVNDVRISGVDTTVTSGSSNVVTSGAVASAIPTNLDDVSDGSTRKLVVLPGSSGVGSVRQIGLASATAASAAAFNAGEASGENSFAEGESVADGDNSHAEGFDSWAIGDTSHAEGITTNAIGDASHAEGNATSAVGARAHAEGYGTSTESSFVISGSANTTSFTTSAAHGLKVGDIVLYEGTYAKIATVPGTTSFTTDVKLSSSAISSKKILIVTEVAYAENSHVEGWKNIAGNNNAHAEGWLTKALGHTSHAEGRGGTANANYSHAEGRDTTASGEASHAEGYVTTTSNQGEHAEGKYNISISGSTIHTVGIGTGASAKKNAHVITTDGKHYIPGIGTYTGTETTLPTGQDLASIMATKAPLASPALTGTPTAPTATAGTNTTQIATTAFVKTAIDALPEPMIFKGSLGTGGTITSLPTASASNEGYTYKVITAGTYASQAAKVGDTFISTGSEWVLIPSGDEPSGTVTSIAISATSPIAIDSSAAITTSGTRTISHANSGVTAGTYRSVTVNATGHVTAGSNPTTISGYGITDAKIASGTITLGSNTITPVTGPASSTDNHIALFNGATGKIIKDSGKTVADLDKVFIINPSTTTWQQAYDAYQAGKLVYYRGALCEYFYITSGVTEEVSFSRISGDGQYAQQYYWGPGTSLSDVIGNKTPSELYLDVSQIIWVKQSTGELPYYAASQAEIDALFSGGSGGGSS